MSKVLPPIKFYYIDYFNPRLGYPNLHFCTTQGNIDIVVYPDTPRIHLRIHLKIDYKCWYTTIIIIRYTRYTTFDLWLKILHRGLEYLYSRFFIFVDLDAWILYYFGVYIYNLSCYLLGRGGRLKRPFFVVRYPFFIYIVDRSEEQWNN